MAIVTVFNLNSFQSVRSSLINSHHEKLSLQTQNIIDQINRDSVPLLNQDIYGYQIWSTSFSESQVVSQQGSFPSSFEKNFNLLLPETYVSNLEPPVILEIEGFTFCVIEQYSSPDNATKTSIVATTRNDEVYGQIKSIKKSLLYNYLFAALIAFVTVILISGLVLKPIKSLISKAQSIKASEQMDRLPVSNAQDELTDLSETINEMIGRIESSIKDQGQFFASASHELRTPLANMLSELDLRITNAENSSDKASFQSFRSEVLRLSGIVEDFLLMSQLKSDTITIHRTNFRLDDLCYDVLEKMNHSIEFGRFEVNLSIGCPSSILIEGDKSKTESILVNLLQNAIKYGSNDQPLRVTISEFKNSLELSIVNKIDFERQKIGGNKLGLWICGQLAEKQGFTFRSSNENGIFTASLTIPFN